jgi:hypothetical protein
MHFHEILDFRDIDSICILIRENITLESIIIEIINSYSYINKEQ